MKVAQGEASAWPAALAGLAALAVAMGIGRFAMTPILPMMQDRGVSFAHGGWLAAANYFGYVAGAVSTISLRIDARLAIRGGLITIGVSTLAMGLVNGFPAWLALRALAGVASAWVLVFVSFWTLERFAVVGRPKLGGVLYAGVGSGIAIAGLDCLVIMQARGSADTAWLTLGALALAISAALWDAFSSPSGPAPDPGSEREPPSAWLLVACYGAYGFGSIVPATFLPAMARQIVSDPLAFGWAWPLFGLAAAASTLAAGSLGASLGPRKVWILCTLIMAFGVAAPLALPGLSGIMVSAVLVGATFVTITLAGMQEARRLFGATARPVMAAMTCAFAFGQLTGPILIVLVDEVPYGINLVLLAATASLLGSATGLYLRR